MRPVCYAQPDKRKSQVVLEAFAAGSNAIMAWTTASELIPGTIPVFYGVRPAWQRLWEQAKAERRDWIYVDNAYFDSSRDKEYRVTLNAIQHGGKGLSDGKRFEGLGLLIKPPKVGGGIVLACAQSAEFMAVVAKDPDWLPRMVTDARRRGERVLIRHKGEARPLWQDLERAKRLITWSSAAAVEAVLQGVAVECAPQCCAYRVGEDVRLWASVLADNQWTLGELAHTNILKRLYSRK